MMFLGGDFGSFSHKNHITTRWVFLEELLLLVFCSENQQDLTSDTR